MAIRIPLGLCIVIARRKGERIPTSGFALLGMTEMGVGGLRRFVVRTHTKPLSHFVTAPPKGEAFLLLYKD